MPSLLLLRRMMGADRWPAWPAHDATTRTSASPTSKDATSAVGEGARQRSRLLWWRQSNKAHSLAAILPSPEDSAAADGASGERFSEPPAAPVPSLDSSRTQLSVRSRVSKQISESKARRVSLERVQRSVNDAILADFLEDAARMPRGARAFTG